MIAMPQTFFQVMSEEEAYEIKSNMTNASEVSIPGADITAGLHPDMGLVTVTIGSGSRATLAMPRDIAVFLGYIK